MSSHRQTLQQPALFVQGVHFISRGRLPQLLVLLVAALTRFWRLGYHSFWFDEAVSLRWAFAAPAYIWDVTFHLVEEKHPPAYYLFLHFWQRLLSLWGLAQNDAALRASGSLLGVLTVLGILLLVTHLSGRRVGLLAGLLVALSPALVWYSQELRMFQPAATGITWGTYFLVRAATVDRSSQNGAEKVERRELAATMTAGDQAPPAVSFSQRLLLWLGVIVALEFALYSYLFSAFALPGIALSLLLLTWHNGRFRLRPLLEGMVALGITTGLFLPLAYNAWVVNRNQSPPGRLFGDFLTNLWRQLQTFTLWKVVWPEPLVLAGLLFFAGLFLLGIVLPNRRRPQMPSRALLLLWMGTPLLVANLLQATNANLFKEDRYYLFLAPFVLWGVSRGIVLLARRRPPLGWSSGGVAILLLLVALPPLWTPRMFRENWRAAADYIVEYQENSPGLPAAGVVHVNYLHPVLEWYLRQTYSAEVLPVYGLFGGPLTPDQVETVIAPPLRGIEGIGAQTLWLVQSHLAGVDEGHLVQGWLDETYPLVTEQHPAGVDLRGYALHSRYDALPELSDQARYPQAELVPGLVLAACEIVTPVVDARDVAMHPPSGWVHVRIWWQAQVAVEEAYQSTARVVDAKGVWGERLSRADEILDRYPTNDWTPGQFVREELDVNLNPRTAAGAYPLVVGLTDGQKESSQTANCGTVQVR